MIKVVLWESITQTNILKFLGGSIVYDPVL